MKEPPRTALPASEAEFGRLAERFRRELHVHCYRMLGSFDEAEDLVQETLLRGWRHRRRFQGRSTVRRWLYRIATNACLDHLRRHQRRAVIHQTPTSAYVEVPWLQPYPDRLLDEVGEAAPTETEPEAALIDRENIQLAYLAAIQLLPPRQRAALLLADVLDWSAEDAAAVLETTVAALNSALQRARATLKKHRPAEPLDWSPTTSPSAEERALVQRYMDATDRSDVDAFVALLHEDVINAMPPQPEFLIGREAVREVMLGPCGLEHAGKWRTIATHANRQPAVACYLRKVGDDTYRAFSIDLMRVENGAVVELISFGPDYQSLFTAFGLPLTGEADMSAGPPTQGAPS